MFTRGEFYSLSLSPSFLMQMLMAKKKENSNSDQNLRVLFPFFGLAFLSFYRDLSSSCPNRSVPCGVAAALFSSFLFSSRVYFVFPTFRIFALQQEGKKTTHTHTLKKKTTLIFQIIG